MFSIEIETLARHADWPLAQPGIFRE